MSIRVGIVGVGVMGSAMGSNLLAAGLPVVCFDVRSEAISALCDLGASPAASPAAVADMSDIVLLSLPSVAALESVVVGDRGLVETRNTDVVCVEMGTLPLADKERARVSLAELGIELLDAPVSGTGLQAKDATLVVFASGDQAAFQRAEQIFDVIGRSTHYVGPFGDGSKMKYVANLLVTVHTLVSAEAHVLGMAAGLNPDLVQRVMSDGIGGSKIFDVRGPMMVNNSYLPPAARLAILLKDARIIRDFAAANGAPTPLLDATIPVYEATVEAGFGDEDAAVLCRHLEHLAGIERH